MENSRQLDAISNHARVVIHKSLIWNRIFWNSAGIKGEGCLRVQARSQPEHDGSDECNSDDQLGCGTKFQTLMVIDIPSCEGLVIELGWRLRGEHMVKVLNQLMRQRRALRYLFANNKAQDTLSVFLCLQ